MVPESNTAEKRDNCRIQAMIDVSTYIDNKKLNTYMHNLSCSGIMIVDHPDCCYEPGRECKITIPVGNNKTLELNAKVVWKKDGLVGLTFSNMDEKTSSNLHQLILRQISEPVSN